MNSGTLVNRSGLVTDIFPWPDGEGFSGGKEWWGHVRQQIEWKRVNQLLGLALLNESIQVKLLMEREENLLDAFELSESTKVLIRTIDANSLTDLAQALSENYIEKD